jgi:hypothetical protein
VGEEVGAQLPRILSTISQITPESHGVKGQRLTERLCPYIPCTEQKDLTWNGLLPLKRDSSIGMWKVVPCTWHRVPKVEMRGPPSRAEVLPLSVPGEQLELPGLQAIINLLWVGLRSVSFLGQPI